MSRVTLRLLTSALLLPSLLTVTGHAQLQIQIQAGGRVQIGGVVQVNPGKSAAVDDDGLSSAPIFVENRAVTNALQAAREQLENLDGVEGDARVQRILRSVGALQQVLDLDKDFAYYPTDDDRSFIRSAKAEAEALIVGLPPDGRALYETEYGPTARAMLAEAIDRTRIAGIEDVVRRYFHTTAGYEATYRLGSFHLDRGEPLAAALVFGRLRSVGIGTWEPLLSLKTAVAWGRAGMPQESVRTLVEFRNRMPGDVVELGGERIPLFATEADALPWLTKVLGRAPNFETLGREQWTMFRGDPARTATTRPASPLWNVRWRYSTIERPGDLDEESLANVLKEYRDLEAKYVERGLLVQPAVHPLVVGETVVFRTMHNVRAVDVTTGETVWESINYDRNFERLLEADPNPQPVQQINGQRIVLNTVQNNNGGVAVTPLQKFVAQRAWGDLTAGTLASDGRFVYSVEDLDFQDGFAALPNGIIVNAAAGATRVHNRLMATRLTTGKLTWELGGPRGEGEFALAGSYFLGPPLPLGNRLFVLLESAGEIQLAVLESLPPADGTSDAQPNVLWTQSLITPEQDISLSPLRKMSGLVPSYADGVIVCPTASGAVVAVDLARRQLAWGYRYPTATPAIPGNPFLGRAVNVAALAGNDDEDRWLDDSPTIADGKVVLTPRDSGELHCIDLVSGKKAWEPKARRDGLYVAGVHDGNVIVVGRSQVHAYKLSDGSDAWTDPIPIGLPAGRGVQAGSLYHVPLREGGIVTIDLAGGRLLATSWSPAAIYQRDLVNVPTDDRAAAEAASNTPPEKRTDEQRALMVKYPGLDVADRPVPGNLVAAAGGLVSISPHEVIAFEPLPAIEEGARRALENDPNDVEALTNRGALNLHQGHEEAALVDLERAIKAGAGEETRELYVATLLEGLRLDFAKYRDRAANSIGLIDDVDQKRAYLRLHARGLEQVGEREQAFAEYVKLAGLRTGKGQLEQTTGHLSVRGDRWIRPRLAELFADAPADQRAAMQRTLEREIAEANAADDPDRLRQLASAVGRLELAEATRRALVEKLDPERHAVERTLLLERMRDSTHVENAAYATATLAATALDAGRYEDAVVWFDLLVARFGDVPCLNGRTGRQLVDEWTAGEDVEAYVATRNPWPAAPMVAKVENGQNGVAQSWPVFVEGSAGPFYEGWTFELDNTRQSLLARDPRGVVAWRLAVRDGGRNVANVYGNFIRTRGHLLVVCLGSYFVVVDPLHDGGEPTIVWSRGLQEAGDNTANVRQMAGPGGMNLVMVDRFGRPLGSVGAVTSEAVYYQVGTRLQAADLMSGEILWELRNVDRGSVVRADEEFVLVVQNDEAVATLLRADDGRLVADRKRIPRSAERIQFEGREVLAWTSTRNGRQLALRDVVSGEDLWTTDASRSSWLSLVEGDEIAILEDGGRFRVLRIADGEPVVDTRLPGSTSIANISVLRTPEHYVLLHNDTTQNANAQIRVAGIGFNNPIVNGDVVAFDRRTGNQVWSIKVENQSLPLGQPLGVPLLVLTSRNFRIIRQPGRVLNTNEFALVLLDTRTGALLLEETGNQNGYPFTLETDPEKQTLKLAFLQRRIDIRFERPAGGNGGNVPADEGDKTENESDEKKAADTARPVEDATAQNAAAENAAAEEAVPAPGVRRQLPNIRNGAIIRRALERKLPVPPEPENPGDEP